MKDQYIQHPNQRTLITGPTYDALIQTRAQHPNATHFIVATKQLGYAGEPAVTINETHWQAVRRRSRQAIILPDHTTAFVEVQR